MKTFIVALSLVLISCGSGSGHQCYDESMLAREWPESSEHVQVVTQVLDAFQCAGFEDPGYAIVFVMSRDQTGPGGVPWSEFAFADTPAKEPDNGYHGYCDRQNCVAYVRAFSVPEWTLPNTLAHELLHGLGYEHGDEMRRAEQKVQRCMK